jgi:hypothetical protein
MRIIGVFLLLSGCVGRELPIDSRPQIEVHADGSAGDIAPRADLMPSCELECAAGEVCVPERGAYPEMCCVLIETSPNGCNACPTCVRDFFDCGEYGRVFSPCRDGQ